MTEMPAEFADENFVYTNDGTRSVMEDNATTCGSSQTSTFTATEELSSATTKDSIGCASLSDSTCSASEYFSTRIQSIMESKSESGTNLEAEIKASKDHWSELQSEDDQEWSADANLELFRRLQHQYPSGFFRVLNDSHMALGEKIAEGAQGEIFKLRMLRPEHADWNDRLLLKVFKEGSSLQDLQKQWPQGMLLKASTSERGRYESEDGSSISGGMMLNDGRFAFLMLRCWGDLRKVIDLRMQQNGNQAPPFTHHTALLLMLNIAKGMRGLHKDNIVHRDLKASNVLIVPKMWESDKYIIPQDGFNPVSDDNFWPSIADFECSLGVWGTRFWRAPEILLGVKNRDVQARLFTEKSDVYSYAMTCYEILTGKIPLEDVRASDYDAILLQGARPILPSGIEPWIESLLSKCWDHDASQRPLFEEIAEEVYVKGFIESKLS